MYRGPLGKKKDYCPFGSEHEFEKKMVTLSLTGTGTVSGTETSEVGPFRGDRGPNSVYRGGGSLASA